MENFNLDVFITIWFVQLFIGFFVIFPLAFHGIIIPKIQKRLKQKLQYKSPIYSFQVFAKWFSPPIEISIAIVMQYIVWKIKKRIPGKISGYNPQGMNPLQLVKYDIRDASKFEIIMSFLMAIEILSFIVGAISAFIIKPIINIII